MQVTMSGMMSFKEVQDLREEERQELIKKYESEGYFRPWAIAKADYEIESIRQANIDKLVALRELLPN